MCGDTAMDGPSVDPPLTRQWTAKELRKRRKKAGHVIVAEVRQTSTNSRPKVKPCTVKPRQPHQSSAGRHTPHTVQIGCFVRIVLPIPHRIPVMGTRAFHKRTSNTGLPSAAKPYIKKKRAGKAKQRHRKWVQKRRSQKRSRKVCQNFRPILWQVLNGWKWTRRRSKSYTAPWRRLECRWQERWMMCGIDNIPDNQRWACTDYIPTAECKRTTPIQKYIICVLKHVARYAKRWIRARGQQLPC